MPFRTDPGCLEGVDILQLMLHRTISYHQQIVNEKYELLSYMIKLHVNFYFLKFSLSVQITPQHKEGIDMVTKGYLPLSLGLVVQNPQASHLPIQNKMLYKLFALPIGLTFHPTYFNHYLPKKFPFHPIIILTNVKFDCYLPFFPFSFISHPV